MLIDEGFRRLSRIALFSELEPEALWLIAFSAETRILRAGDILFRRGEPSDGGFIVLSGAIALHNDAASGFADAIIGPEGLVGEIALITDTHRPVTAVANEASTVLKVPRSLFHRVLQEFPRSAARVRAVMANRLTSFVGELAAFRSRVGAPEG